jgi:hypothetical protein
MYLEILLKMTLKDVADGLPGFGRCTWWEVGYGNFIAVFTPPFLTALTVSIANTIYTANKELFLLIASCRWDLSRLSSRTVQRWWGQ